ncbi:MAG TPA: SAM-dependent chlorinase/fluorinase [Longimicrobiales bacterium]
MTRITLLTDFGTADGYVAAMKGVIAAIAPDVAIDDAAHDVPPGDVAAAALALARYWRLYPPGTVHLVVVDPGVGTARRALAARADGRFFVAPDNGVLTDVLAAEGGVVVAIENPDLRRPTVSATFHGRDVFAPAAAHLARGVALDEFGPPVEDPVRLERTRPERTREGVRGAVIHVDRFGNLITDIPGEWVRGAAAVEVAGRSVGAPRRTYGDVAPGAALALVGSTGALEISVRDGSAAAAFGVGRGAEVRVHDAPDP